MSENLPATLESKLDVYFSLKTAIRENTGACSLEIVYKILRQTEYAPCWERFLFVKKGSPVYYIERVASGADVTITVDEKVRDFVWSNKLCLDDYTCFNFSSANNCEIVVRAMKGPIVKSPNFLADEFDAYKTGDIIQLLRNNPGLFLLKKMVVNRDFVIAGKWEPKCYPTRCGPIDHPPFESLSEADDWFQTTMGRHVYKEAVKHDIEFIAGFCKHYWNEYYEDPEHVKHTVKTARNKNLPRYKPDKKSGLMTYMQTPKTLLGYAKKDFDTKEGMELYTTLYNTAYRCIGVSSGVSIKANNLTSDGVWKARNVLYMTIHTVCEKLDNLLKAVGKPLRFPVNYQVYALGQYIKKPFYTGIFEDIEIGATYFLLDSLEDLLEMVKEDHYIKVMSGREKKYTWQTEIKFRDEVVPNQELSFDVQYSNFCKAFDANKTKIYIHDVDIFTYTEEYFVKWMLKPKAVNLVDKEWFFIRLDKLTEAVIEREMELHEELNSPFISATSDYEMYDGMIHYKKLKGKEWNRLVEFWLDSYKFFIITHPKPLDYVEIPFEVVYQNFCKMWDETHKIYIEPITYDDEPTIARQVAYEWKDKIKSAKAVLWFVPHKLFYYILQKEWPVAFAQTTNGFFHERDLIKQLAEPNIKLAKVPLLYQRPDIYLYDLKYYDLNLFRKHVAMVSIIAITHQVMQRVTDHVKSQVRLMWWINNMDKIKRMIKKWNVYHCCSILARFWSKHHYFDRKSGRVVPNFSKGARRITNAHDSLAEDVLVIGDSLSSFVKTCDNSFLKWQARRGLLDPPIAL